MTIDLIQADIELIEKIPIVETMLQTICQTTGMGFAAIARVTKDRWVACGVADQISFGLKVGGELEVKTTLCHEVQAYNEAIVIDNVSESEQYRHHHTPALYGLQSYISVPIYKRNGEFFGTLCAIDPHPHNVDNPSVRGMFALFCDLIAFHIDAVEKLATSASDLQQERAFNDELEIQIKRRTTELEEKNTALEQVNAELQSFNYISSHDLQEPLRKIQNFVSMIEAKELQQLSTSGQYYFQRLQQAAKRMQLLLNDLLAFSQANFSSRQLEPTDLAKLLVEVQDELSEEIAASGAQLSIGDLGTIPVVPFQLKQLFHNLIANSIKFAAAGQAAQIAISGKTGNKADFATNGLVDEMPYYNISFSDNGIGFDQRQEDKIFEIFKRLHNQADYPGTGIGLAIVKKIVHNHQGVIKATGMPGKGSTFNIYLPSS